MTEHSLLGASSAHRWLNCPGSFRLSETAPHRPASIYAALGTVAHRYIEDARHSFKKISRREVGKTWQCDGHSGTINQDFLDGVNVMIGYLGQAWEQNKVVAVEERVSLDTYFPAAPISLFGTVDAIVCSHLNRELEIVDYKNGAGIAVSPIENPQLLYYAAGAITYDPEPFKHIKLTIVQPHAGGDPIRSWEIDFVDLLMWIDEVLKPGVEACVAPDALLVPGTWCRFCPVSHACPKLMADAIEMAKAEFDDVLPAPGSVEEEGYPGSLVSSGSNDELAKALDTAERAELWIARIREFAVDQLERQVRIPGWGLVPTRPTRKWLAPDTDIAQRLSGLGATHDEVWETKVRSPAQVEKQLHRTRKGRLIWDQAAVMVEARSSGVKLGRNSADVGEDFDDDAA